MKKKELLQKLNNNKIINESITFANAMSKKNLATNAASIAFYFFMSMIPLFILLCSLLPFTGITRYELTNIITGIMPDTIGELVSSVISEAYSVHFTIFSVSIVFLLWSSSKGMLALIRSLDVIYSENDSRSYFVMVGNSILYTLFILISIGGLLFIYAKGHSAEEIIKTALPTKSLFEKFAKHSHKLNVLLIMAISFALIYKAAPAGKRKFIHQIPGAMFASIGISVFSYFFAIYSKGSNIYNSFYGSLTSVTVFLLWLYSCFNILLLGGTINSQYKDKFHSAWVRIKRKKIKSKK